MTHDAPTSFHPISVVIPLFNKEKRIGKCLYSVLAQSTSPDEIIVVDDGSTDNGVKVVEDILKNWTGSSKIIRQPNQGAATARNKGIAIVRNHLVALLDGDDEWHPGFIERMSRLEMDFPAAVLYCAANTFEDSFGRRRIVRPWIKKGFRGYVPNFFFSSLIGSVANSSKVVVRKDALNEVGGFPAARAGEDLHVWVQLAMRFPVAFDDFVGSKVTVIPDESRVNRMAELPFPISYYSENAPDGLGFFGRLYLRRIFISHFLIRLRNGEFDLAKRENSVVKPLFPLMSIAGKVILMSRIVWVPIARTLRGAGNSFRSAR